MTLITKNKTTHFSVNVIDGCFQFPIYLFGIHCTAQLILLTTQMLGYFWATFFYFHSELCNNLGIVRAGKLAFVFKLLNKKTLSCLMRKMRLTVRDGDLEAVALTSRRLEAGNCRPWP